MASTQHKVFENIIKSVEDSRHYKALELNNGFKIFLVSDPQTDKSAAALNVNIGFMHDPPELPGLAHFCEHMLFLGTTKYPDEEAYTKFINQHGGSSNAFTVEANTCYYFDISPMYLNEALDRFSQFFLSPLFTQSATEREVNSINSEYEKNFPVDIWRLNQLERFTCNPNHDYAKFGAGNIETLDTIPSEKGINVRDELLKFHDKYYSANLMCLAVLGKETLDELEKMVVPLFTCVENKHIEVPEWVDHPFDTDHLKLQGYVVPVKEIRGLNITFPIPDFQKYYKSSPGHYVSHLIGHEGPGSLLSELKAKGWALTLSSGYKCGAKGFAFFVTQLNLTQEGIEYIEDIVTLFFQYVHMLRETGSKEWIFEELKKLSAVHFRFKDRESPQSYVVALSSSMHKYPMNEVLCGPMLIEEYCPDVIIELLNYLTPENIRMAIIGKEFENVANQTEKWYGTKYKIEPIKDDVLKKWGNVALNDKLKLPSKNNFIPENFELVEREQKYNEVPKLIKDTNLTQLWFKQDDEFKLPKGTTIILFESPLAFVDPSHCNMLELFANIFKDSITEEVYDAQLADLSYELTISKYGLVLYISGFSDKQYIFIKMIMEKLMKFEVDEKKFEIMRETSVRSLRSFNSAPPYEHAIYYSILVVAEKLWSKEEQLTSIIEITPDQVQQFCRSYFKNIYITAFVHGNYLKEQALSMISVLENTIKENSKIYPLFSSQKHRYREHDLGDGGNYIYETVNDVYRCCAVQTSFQCGLQDTRTNMLVELFTQVIRDPCFQVLRVQEQLGYIVVTRVRRNNGVQSIEIIIQSEKVPEYLDNRIEAFLVSIEKLILDMPNETFDDHKNAVITRITEKPKRMDLQSAKLWNEIFGRQYKFNRDEVEAECLKLFTKDELYEFFKEKLSVDAPKRKKLAVYIVSSILNYETPSSNVNDVLSCESLSQVIEEVIPPPLGFRLPIKVENIAEFKSSLGLYPVTSCIVSPPSVEDESSQ